jgi:hypothetical protein
LQADVDRHLTASMRLAFSQVNRDLRLRGSCVVASDHAIRARRAIPLIPHALANRPRANSWADPGWNIRPENELSRYE